MSRSNDEQFDDPCLGALQLCHSLAFPMSFKAALELKVFETIAREGDGALVSAAHIASQLPTVQDPEAAASRLDRMFRLLVSHSLLTCNMQTLEDGNAQMLYGLTPMTRIFFAGGEEHSLASMIAINTHKATVDVWQHYKDAILEGGGMFQKVHGTSLFDYMEKDLIYNNIFNKAKAELTDIIMKKVIEIYKGFEGLNSLVEIGGGTGKCLNMVISKYPSIKAINFDFPHKIQTAPSYSGIKHLEGDMFNEIPNADAIMAKDILHNWDDEHCLKLLKKCYGALPDNGKVIVINVLMPEVPDSSMASKYVSKLDNAMLLLYGAKERTGSEFEALCKGSGFSNFRIVCLAHSVWAIMEFSK